MTKKANTNSFLDMMKVHWPHFNRERSISYLKRVLDNAGSAVYFNLSTGDYCHLDTDDLDAVESPIIDIRSLSKAFLLIETRPALSTIAKGFVVFDTDKCQYLASNLGHDKESSWTFSLLEAKKWDTLDASLVSTIQKHASNPLMIRSCFMRSISPEALRAVSVLNKTQA